MTTPKAPAAPARLSVSCFCLSSLSFIGKDGTCVAPIGWSGLCTHGDRGRFLERCRSACSRGGSFELGSWHCESRDTPSFLKVTFFQFACGVSSSLQLTAAAQQLAAVCTRSDPPAFGIGITRAPLCFSGGMQHGDRDFLQQPCTGLQPCPDR